MRRAMLAAGADVAAVEAALDAADDPIPPDEDEVLRQQEELDWCAAVREEEKPVEPESSVEQGILFDQGASDAARDRAMARVDAAADPEWKDRARAAIETVIRRGHEFTADDVWAELQEFPAERRALGPLLRAFAEAGQIHNTGRRRNSTRPEHHSFPCTIWLPL